MCRSEFYTLHRVTCPLHGKTILVGNYNKQNIAGYTWEKLLRAFKNYKQETVNKSADTSNTNPDSCISSKTSTWRSFFKKRQTKHDQPVFLHLMKQRETWPAKYVSEYFACETW